MIATKGPGTACDGPGLASWIGADVSDTTLPAEKLCSRCKASKPLEDFSPHKNGLFGRYSQCRSCTAEIGRARYKPHPILKQAAPEGMKRCSVCTEAKPFEYFGKDNRWKGGYRSACLACSAKQSTDSRNRNPEHHGERVRQWSKANADKQRAYRLKRLYNLTVERFDEMLAEQGGGCALCGSDCTVGRWDRLAVDHDHACCRGKTSCGRCVRGILCGRCNNGLGLLEAAPGLLEAAVRYVERYRLKRAQEDAAC